MSIVGRVNYSNTSVGAGFVVAGFVDGGAGFVDGGAVCAVTGAGFVVGWTVVGSGAVSFLVAPCQASFVHQGLLKCGRSTFSIVICN